MRRVPMVIAIWAALLSSGSFAHGQEATERFIPIGQSPGISGKVSMIGSISSVDQTSQRIQVMLPQGSVNVRISDSTHIWVDRSAQHLPPATGTFADLQKGFRVEVKYTDSEISDTAAWVKVDPRE